MLNQVSIRSTFYDDRNFPSGLNSILRSIVRGQGLCGPKPQDRRIEQSDGGHLQTEIDAGMDADSAVAPSAKIG